MKPFTLTALEEPLVELQSTTGIVTSCGESAGMDEGAPELVQAVPVQLPRPLAVIRLSVMDHRLLKLEFE